MATSSHDAMEIIRVEAEIGLSYLEALDPSELQIGESLDPSADIFRRILEVVNGWKANEPTRIESNEEKARLDLDDAQRANPDRHRQ